jgi:hypothetical protein
VRASRKATAALNSQLAIPGLRPTLSRWMFGVPVAAWPVTERHLVLGDQAQLEQLETVEEAEDLIPAPRPDRLHGPLVHRLRLADGCFAGEALGAYMGDRRVAPWRDGGANGCGSGAAGVD